MSPRLLLVCSVIAPLFALAQGSTFHLGFLQNYQGGAAHELTLYISSEVMCSGTVTQPQTALTIPFTVVPGTTTEVVIPDYLQHSASEQVENKGLIVQASGPVSVQAMNFEEYSTDGSNILPSDQLGLHYIVMAYEGYPGQPDLKSEFLVVATVDSTLVTITPSVPTEGGNAAGIPFTTLLNAGQSMQVKAATAAADLTGTFVDATTSGACTGVAVFGGARCSKVPIACTACDHLYEQMIPVERWGLEHHVVGFVGPSSYTLRVMAAEDSTIVDVDGNVSMLNGGQWIEMNYVAGSKTVVSNKPSAVAQYMEGVTCVLEGDPALLMIPAADQGITAAVFSTLTSFSVTDVRLGLSTDSANAGQVLLDGTPIPPGDFVPYANMPGRVHADVVLSQGSHLLTAPLPFIAHTYGYGPAGSYAQGVGLLLSTAFGADTVVCHAGGPITLSAPSNYVTPYWYAEGQPQDTLGTGMQFTLSTTTDTVIVVGNGTLIDCFDNLAFHIEVPLQGALDLSATTGSICANQAAALAATTVPPAAVNWAWSPSGSVVYPYQASTQAYPLQDTWYVARATTPGGCWWAEDSVLVNVEPNTLTAAVATAADATICTGTTAQLHALVERALATDEFNGGLAAWWTGAYGGGVGLPCQAQSGQALVFDGSGARGVVGGPLDLQGSARVRFSIIIGNGANGCDDAEPGEDVLCEFSSDGGATWGLVTTMVQTGYADWTFMEAQLPAAALVPGALLRWRQVGAFVAAQDVWALDNVVVITEDNGAVSYAWSPANLLNDATIADPIASPAGSTTFTLVVQDSLGTCSATSSIDVDVAGPSIFNLPADILLCDTATVVVATDTSGTGWAYAWTVAGGQVGAVGPNSVSASMTGAGHVALMITNDHGCTSTDTVFIAVASVPGGAAIVQSGDSLCAAAIGPWNYQWFYNNLPVGGANQPCLLMQQGGLYALEIDGGAGCLASGSGLFWMVGIEQHAAPPIIISTDADGLLISSGTRRSVEVWSTTGQLVRRAQLAPGAGGAVHVPLHTTGVYVIRASGTSDSFTARVPFIAQ